MTMDSTFCQKSRPAMKLADELTSVCPVPSAAMWRAVRASVLVQDVVAVGIDELAPPV
jgi:hypothetical protein